ncbi:hypothetical protein K2173_016407 [Erythroxylum novogranatense]|uniref:DUF1677 family protein n=1 Tax=Erythroxylum novogranatense TaxID=1862640 RepID=A0AAV8SG50_9ROSI|nr:hypothetical protein K2173_016407 [Erythroxylum novogranatense]
MAQNREPLVASYPKNSEKVHIPHRLSMESLQRTISDISSELSKETTDTSLASIAEVENAKCECCGMSEECTHEYIKRVRDKLWGKFVCGLCAEAVNREMEKNGGKRKEALNDHISACLRFNKVGRAYPVLCQAETMREILKKSSVNRGKSTSPRDREAQRKGSIARSSSCIPAIIKETGDRRVVN